MDVRVNGSGDEAILELPAYSIGQNKATTDDSGDVELRVWVGGEDGDWKWPTTPDSVDAIIDAAREGE